MHSIYYCPYARVDLCKRKEKKKVLFLTTRVRIAMHGIEKHFLPARPYSSFKNRCFDRSTNAAETGWIGRERRKKWNRRAKREKCGSRISTRGVSDVIVRRKIYPAFIFDPSDALHFPLLSHLECCYSFAKALSNHRVPSQPSPRVGMQSFGML